MTDSLSDPSSVFGACANTMPGLNATLTNLSPRDRWELAKLWCNKV